MSFQVRAEHRPNKLGLDDRVWVLQDPQGNFVEIAPAIGFNAYRWHVAEGELLFADPKFFEEHKPTRSGFPILFPFPNRIREGRFTWNGHEYRLPTNDSSGKNAIHGFVCQRPWRVADQGADAHAAWVTGEFIGSKDAPATLELWPADYRIVVTYTFKYNSLLINAEMSNSGNDELPWGLGYHPYFALAPFGGPEARIRAPANKYWELEDNLPTGRLYPVDRARDLRGGTAYGSLHLDDVLSDLTPMAPGTQLGLRGVLEGNGRRLEMHTSGIFREIVAFTPPHRQAICLEPYTCTTDAINLQARGVDAGWRVLGPGQTAAGTVALSFRTRLASS